jgi:hypothetical protein
MAWEPTYLPRLYWEPQGNWQAHPGGCLVLEGGYEVYEDRAYAPATRLGEKSDSLEQTSPKTWVRCRRPSPQLRYLRIQP